MIDVRIVSIGALAANHLWNERSPVRTGHATTTLVRAEDRVIVVDPGLPANVVAARLHERAGIGPDAVTHVFVTSFQPDTWRGVEAFPEAEWMIAEAERDAAAGALGEMIAELGNSGGDSPDAERELQFAAAILRRFTLAPDRLCRAVDLFPLHGVTPGLTGLLVSESDRTTLVCGDAVPTLEHLTRSVVLPGSADLEKAKDAFREAVEIADILIPGRDDLIPIDL